MVRQRPRPLLALITTLYSPSHELRTTRTGDRELAFEVPQAAIAEPGSFRLSALVDKAGADGLSTSIISAYPDPQNPDGGGYFLFLGGVAESKARVHEQQKREVIMVIDRSGSMRVGEKIEQARNAAIQVIDGLAEGEAFNIIDYSSTVEKFSKQPVLKDAKTTSRCQEVRPRPASRWRHQPARCPHGGAPRRKPRRTCCPWCSS